MNITKIMTHSGPFHPDDVFAVSVLRRLFPVSEVIRTRDASLFDTADIIVDVGDNYDGKRAFDHHQKSDDLVRKDGVPYSSAGLIWNTFGHHYVDAFLGEENNPDLHRDVYDMLYERFVNPIDHDDNGVAFRDFDISYLKTVSAFIPSWKHSDDITLMDERFMMAVDYMSMTISIEIMRLRRHLDEMDSQALVEKAIEVSTADKRLNRLRVVELSRGMPCKRIVCETDFNFILSPRKEEWMVECVPVEPKSFDSRIPLPEALAGLKNEELSVASGVNDGVFCHKARFIAVFGSRESCLMVIERAIEEFNLLKKQELVNKFTGD